MAGKTRFAQFLGVLTDEENDYFLRSFDAFEQPAPSFENPLQNPVLDDFAGLMARQRTAGSYLDILAVLVPVEWVYLTWASEAAEAVTRGGVMPERFLPVGMDHAARTAGVQGLRRVDACGVSTGRPLRQTTWRGQGLRRHSRKRWCRKRGSSRRLTKSSAIRPPPRRR